MARFAPFALIAVAATWVTVVLLAGTLVFWGLGDGLLAPGVPAQRFVPHHAGVHAGDQ